MLIALCTSTNIVRLVNRDEEAITHLLESRPELNFFFLSSDIPTHVPTLTTEDRGPHLLTECWCGGA